MKLSGYEAHCPIALPNLKMELHRGEAFRGLMAAVELHTPLEQSVLDFFVQPMEVRAKIDIDAKALKLVPTTDYGRLSVKPSSSQVAITTSEKVSFYVDKPNTLRSQNNNEWPKDGMLAAFWWVKITDDPSEANVKLVKMTSEGCAFPIYENSKKLKRADRLTIYEPPTGAKKAKKRDAH